MDIDLVRVALQLLEEGETFAWAGIIGTRGSSPRHGGASMLVRADGSIAGTVGGGGLEAWAIKQALSVLEADRPSVQEFQLTPQDAAGLGMVCGGRGRMILEPVSPSHHEVKESLEALAAWADEGRRGWLVTTVSGSEQHGWRITRRLVEAGADMGLPADGDADGDAAALGAGSLSHADPVGFEGTAYVFGAGHCGEKLVPVLGLAGFATVILDDRSEFAHRGRFPTADRVIVLDSFDQGMDGLPTDDDSYIVIVTRGHLHDRSVLAQALRTEAGYIGMIGSRKKIAAIYQALRDEGFSEADLARVHSPIGLEIGAETPGEIAISIAAELVQVRSELIRGRRGT